MKCDMVRAWKDELYRQTLHEEQRRTLPANPAGELTSDDLQTIYGGGLPSFGSLGASFASKRHCFHSFAFFCQENVFSLNVNRSADFLSPVNNVCVN